MKDLLEFQEHFIIWKQKKKPIYISIFVLDQQAIGISYEKLTAELVNRNITFSLYYEKLKTYLILYGYKSNPYLDDILVTKYKLVKLNSRNNIFVPIVSKIEKKGEDLLQVFFGNGTKKYYSIYMLSMGSLNEHSEEFISKIIEANTFNTVISYFPSKKDKEHSYQWGFLIIIDGDSIEMVETKIELLNQMIQTTNTLLNWKLISVSKRELVNHLANFRLYVPWKRIDISYSKVKVFSVKNLTQTKLKQTVQTNILKKMGDLKIAENDTVLYHTKNRKEPHPSVKHLKNSKSVQNHEVVPTPLAIPRPPKPQPYDNEQLKLHILNSLKHYSFRTTLLFQDSFDLALRNNSFYILVKIVDDVLAVKKIYEIIDQVDSIAGLKNKFLCIVIADYIENKVFSIIHGYPIICLQKEDILKENELLSKISEYFDMSIYAPNRVALQGVINQS